MIVKMIECNFRKILVQIINTQIDSFFLLTDSTGSRVEVAKPVRSLESYLNMMSHCKGERGELKSTKKMS